MPATGVADRGEVLVEGLGRRERSYDQVFSARWSMRSISR
jgi:hypothetical protein